jgi:NhaA family Na+:H+ antiporter
MSGDSRVPGWLYTRPRDFVYQRVVLTAQAFMQVEAAGGMVLLAAAVAAMVWANSAWDDAYFDFWHTPITVDADILHIDLDLQEWVNDGLMTLFFFLMGLEIKRELVHGELSSPRRALLPAAGALGGMIAPALIYTAFNAGGDGADGWGVPMATDIAFAVGVLSLLGRRVPFSIKVFLLALAIADDIGAIVVIAVFYTADLDFLALGLAACTLAGVFALNRSGVRNINVYVVFGAVLWLTMLESGIHATIAGVVLGLLAPATSFYGRDTFAEDAADLTARFRAARASGDADAEQGILAQMEDLAQGTEAPLDRLERALHPWVSFLIVPLFALANAGVHVSGDVAEAALESPISQGVALGLLLGKPLGIFLFTWLAVRLRVCEMPAGATWSHILGVGILGGIGFTVALLIADLGFHEEALIDEAKLGVLAGSIASGIAGFIYLWLTSARRGDSTALEPNAAAT